MPAECCGQEKNALNQGIAILGPIRTPAGVGGKARDSLILLVFLVVVVVVVVVLDLVLSPPPLGG